MTSKYRKVIVLLSMSAIALGTSAYYRWEIMEWTFSRVPQLIAFFPETFQQLVLRKSDINQAYAEQLVAQALDRSPSEAVSRLSQILQEHRDDLPGTPGHVARWKAVQALDRFEPELKAKALPELIYELHYGSFEISVDGRMIMIEMRGKAAPAVPELLEILVTGEPLWRPFQAASILERIAFDLKTDFPDREKAIEIIGRELVNPETITSVAEELTYILKWIDPSGEYCLLQLQQAATDGNSYVREAAIFALSDIGERNLDVRQWLSENTDIDLAKRYGNLE